MNLREGSKPFWICCFGAMSVALASARVGWTADYFAAPHGSRAGSGTRKLPWDLSTVLSGAAPVRAGDTVWLLGGVYRGHFTSKLQGSIGNPITVRQAQGQRATIDCRSTQGKNPLFQILGDWTVFRDFEVTCSDPRRDTKNSGSWPPDVHRGGVVCRASHVKLINLIVHDLGDGISIWSDGEAGEVYGCLIYNNGWRGPDRGHGHGVYAQNRRGVKRIADNLVFNQFGYGLHCYGSARAQLIGFQIEGNITFNNGCWIPGARTTGILLGGRCAVGRAKLIGNVVYSDGGGQGIRLGYSSRVINSDAIVRNNYVVGNVLVHRFKQLTYTGNTLIGEDTIARIEQSSEPDRSASHWDGNHYFHRRHQYQPFTITRGDQSIGVSFRKWQSLTGFDTHSLHSEELPANVRVFIRPNAYCQGRAHVAVLNWDRRDAVEVDLSSVLRRGQNYRVVNAQDFYGESVARGTYRGNTVGLDMRTTKVSLPIGLADCAPPTTAPQFAAFVVLPD